MTRAIEELQVRFSIEKKKSKTKNKFELFYLVDNLKKNQKQSI